jgi:hypothetical protein
LILSTSYLPNRSRSIYTLSLKALHEPQCIPQAAIAFSKSIPKLDIPCSGLKTSNSWIAELVYDSALQILEI